MFGVIEEFKKNEMPCSATKSANFSLEGCCSAIELHPPCRALRALSERAAASSQSAAAKSIWAGRPPAASRVRANGRAVDAAPGDRLAPAVPSATRPCWRAAENATMAHRGAGAGEKSA